MLDGYFQLAFFFGALFGLESLLFRRGSLLLLLDKSVFGGARVFRQKCVSFSVRFRIFVNFLMRFAPIVLLTTNKNSKDDTDS
jgi:hypothetical protein